MRRISRRGLLGAAGGALGAAAGCTNRSPGDGDGTTAEGETTGGTTGGNGSTEPVEAWNEPNHFDHMNAAARTFNENHESQIEPVEQSQLDSLTEEVLRVMNAGDPAKMPGATIVRSQFLQRAAREGGVAELNDLMSDHVDDLFPAAKTKHRVDGDWYSTPQDLGPTLWFYNRDLFEQAGLPTNPEDVASEIQTWSEFGDAAETMESEIGVKMFAATASESVVPVEVLGMMGGVGPFYDADGQFKFDKAGNVRAMKTLNDLLPYAKKTWMFQGDGSFWGSYRNGEIASMPYPAWATGFIKENLQDQAGKWRVTKLPYHSEDPKQQRSGNLGGEPIMTPAAKSQRAKRVAKEFATTWNLSEAGFNAKLEAGVFPAVDIESAAALEKTDEFFGGQKANQAMAQAARAGGPSRYAPNPQVEEKMLVATQSILGDGQPVEETLSTYHDQMVELVSEDAMEIEVDV